MRSAMKTQLIASILLGGAMLMPSGAMALVEWFEFMSPDYVAELQTETDTQLASEPQESQELKTSFERTVYCEDGRGNMRKCGTVTYTTELESEEGDETDVGFDGGWTGF